MKVLVLEDSHIRVREFKQRLLEKGWVGTFVESAMDAIKMLKEKKFDLIFLDHDLGDETYVDTYERNTGSEVARWLNEHPVKAVVVIHSLNLPAAEYMQSLIKGSYLIPYVWTEERFKAIKA